MNTRHDNDIDDVLERAGEYLMRRTAEYREQPVALAETKRSITKSGRRILVGAAAVASLTTAALVGSFSGGTLSGKVDVAQAAWSAVPSQPTVDISNDVANDCRPVVNDVWGGVDQREGATPASVPGGIMVPNAVEMRGSTAAAVYFMGSLAMVCLRFADGSVHVGSVEMLGTESAGIESGTLSSVSVRMDDQLIGLVLGFLPDGDAANWDVSIEQNGRVEPIKTTIVADAGRYMAWTPTGGDVLVKFVNKSTGDGKHLGPIQMGSEKVPLIEVISTVPNVPLSP